MPTTSNAALAQPVASASPSAPEALQRWLEPSDFADAKHPEIMTATNAVIGGMETPREKAIAIHDFVRDSVRFGWTSRFWDMRASDVLRAGIGYCNTKTTLFIAMARAAGIPARAHFVTIDARILDGLISPPARWLEHSFAEVWLDGRWIAVDSYIADLPLAERARSRLEAEGRELGYGVHRRGTSTWNGHDPAFSQFVTPPAVGPLSNHDYGVFRDTADFYDQGLGDQRLDGLQGIMTRILAPFGNRPAERLRRG